MNEYAKKLAAETLAADDPRLLTIEDDKASVIEVCDALAELAGGEAPRLQIDITDPPSLPRARVGELEAIGVDPDDAVTQLGLVAADDLHTRIEARLAKQAQLDQQREALEARRR